ncbi:MAG TPA: folylpolyglutamate synthase/dihydrofolate synthase family protein [Fimbriimonadaceae bacterium]|nr:folylpolyglutamate synthase/dihydrofolate synthase family protein [Fimbriimonadaceae bacterium]
MDYSDALAYIAGLSHRGWRLGLDRMEEFIRLAGLQSATGGNLDSAKFLHVAGTNGKGSVTAYLESMLRHSGYRTGAFFSPYVYDIRERVQANGDLISPEDMARLTERLAPISDAMEATEFGGATEFEFKTALGFAFWQEKKSEWVALEVGLGGRLDATNVVHPAASAIVSIGLDHTAILGNTLGEIAREKAGIIKPGIPSVTGRLPDEALSAVETIAKEKGSHLWRLGREFEVERETEEGWKVRTPLAEVRGIRPPLPGAHQVENMAVAVAMMVASRAYLDESSIREGLAAVRIPGRFEIREHQGRTIILDGAHNTESMQSLCMTLQERFKGQKFQVVFGMVQGHDPAPVCAILDDIAAAVQLSPIDFHRSQPPEELSPYFHAPVTIHHDSSEAIQAALNAPVEGPILVTGSFYLVGEIGNGLAPRSAGPRCQ